MLCLIRSSNELLHRESASPELNAQVSEARSIPCQGVTHRLTDLATSLPDGEELSLADGDLGVIGDAFDHYLPTFNCFMFPADGLPMSVLQLTALSLLVGEPLATVSSSGSAHTWIKAFMQALGPLLIGRFIESIKTLLVPTDLHIKVLTAGSQLDAVG